MQSEIYGLIDECVPLYRALRAKQESNILETIRRTEHESDAWDLSDSFGYVVLESKRRFDITNGDYYLLRYRRIGKVRREAAARLLRAQSFSINNSRNFLLYTSLLIVHPDDSIEVVPNDNFTVSDSDEDDVFITVENRQLGHWILPDLAPNDIIVLECDLLG